MVKEQESAETGVFFVPERQQRLDLILHLIPNTQQAILLRGPEQSGKSFFIKQLKHQLNPRWPLFSIKNHELMAEKEPLQMLAAVLDEGEVKKPIFSRLEAWDKAGKKVIICVEDAHTLDAERFNFLFQLVENYNCIHLLLTSSESLGEKIESRCHLVDIEPLTQRQTSEYARTLLNKRGLAKTLDLAGIDELVLFIETGGLPGLINHVLEHMQPPPAADGNKKKGLGNDQRKWVLLGLVVVLSIGLVFGLYQQQSVMSADGVTARVLEPQPVSSPVVAQEVINKIGRESDGSLLATFAANKRVLVAANSPKVQASLGAKLGEQVRVEEKIEAVTQLRLKPEADEKKVADDASIKSDIVKQAETAVDERAIIKPVAKPVAKVVSKTQIEKSHHWIATRQAGRYTLQLLGVSTEEAASNYITGHSTLNTLLFFKNKRNAGAWYSIIYGDFPSLAAAEKSAKSLPKSLGQLKPWVRRFEAIQAEVFVKK